jgi:hypothetical protein
MMKTRFSWATLVVFSSALAGGNAWAGKVYSVNSTSDNTTRDGKCTIREALNEANNNANPGFVANPDCPPANTTSTEDHVKLSAGSTYNLGNPLITTSEVRFRSGTTNSLATVVGASNKNTFEVKGSFVAYFQDVVISHASKTGAGVLVFSPAHARMDRVVVKNNRIGISVNDGGFFTCNTYCTIRDNDNGSNDGGGIYSAGPTSILHIEKASIHHNRAGQGAGIFSRGNMELRDSSIYSNTSIGYGGGILIEGDSARLDAKGVTVTRNVSTDGTGSGVVRFGYGFVEFGYTIVSANNDSDCEGIWDNGDGQVIGYNSVMASSCFPLEFDPMLPIYFTDDPQLSTTATTKYPENVGFKPRSTSPYKNAGGMDIDQPTDQHGRTRTVSDGVAVGAMEP